MEEAVTITLTDEQREVLEEPVTKEDVRRAIFQGAKNKAPGVNGISLEFFQDTWDDHADL
jgi:hypothetical protein